MSQLDAAPYGAKAVTEEGDRNDPDLRERVTEALRRSEADTWRILQRIEAGVTTTPCEGVAVVTADAFQWLARVPDDSLHGIVTDPPYGLIEYEQKDHTKLRERRGGVWRIPPSFDGVERAPLPRFTVLTEQDKKRLDGFFARLGALAARKLVPGGHLMIASTPLLSTTTFACLERAGLEKRGEIIRLVQTLRGGDRPKGAEREFADVSVMPRACWEPWGLFRKPISERTISANLRRWGTGGLRRISGNEPFRDVVESAPTRAIEREIAPHPSLKPQRFMRQIVRAVLPLGLGVLFDPFAGGGSTLAAAARVGYKAIGTELDADYSAMAHCAVPLLRDLYADA
ncbi:MAG TPA: DNA methyltransferase [Alphaproteobacteria bacterium]|nr:DNA methyltransferase [Alphaproteobacteria bacterium]